MTFDAFLVGVAVFWVVFCALEAASDWERYRLWKRSKGRQ